MKTKHRIYHLKLMRDFAHYYYDKYYRDGSWERHNMICREAVEKLFPDEAPRVLKVSYCRDHFRNAKRCRIRLLLRTFQLIDGMGLQERLLWQEAGEKLWKLFSHRRHNPTKRVVHIVWIRIEAV